ncbi:hypothetical protein Ssi03_03490 [Sphaerisporangium siamense]|uniref:Uncharacterized protein n=1 Tax=Sphaerisporangium siamense TaxID=795645 RepID=A0A7W7DBQ2_9ACTN|nr:hypothetical protein [Sphaerisporangium siamense]MBB4703890.1 hypothetical protein [Sphaerisporangium siamense]GII82359.1 hypothetical protein Ssi03_03490 [Sphaerisporangium siamense]
MRFLIEPATRRRMRVNGRARRHGGVPQRWSFGGYFRFNPA